MKKGKYLLLLLAMVLLLSGCAQYDRADPNIHNDEMPAPSNNKPEQILKPITGAFENIDQQIVFDGKALMVDATIAIPSESSVADISIIEIEYGGPSCNITAAMDLFAKDSKLEKKEYNAFEQAGKLVEASVVQKHDASGAVLELEIFSYPGRFAFSSPLPDHVLTEYVESPMGAYSDNGVAANCNLTSLDATKSAVEIAENIKLPVDGSIAKAYPISPTEQSSISCGYYVVGLPQRIDGIPVAMFNLPIMVSSIADVSILPPVTGALFQVFDFGTLFINSFWLDTGTAKILHTYPEIIPLDSAMRIADNALEPTTNRMKIRDIRFEYAVVDNNGSINLIPAWTFDSNEGASKERFVGIRIDAITGKIILMNVEEQP